MSCQNKLHGFHVCSLWIKTVTWGRRREVSLFLRLLFVNGWDVINIHVAESKGPSDTQDIDGLKWIVFAMIAILSILDTLRITHACYNAAPVALYHALYIFDCLCFILLPLLFDSSHQLPETKIQRNWWPRTRLNSWSNGRPILVSVSRSFFTSKIILGTHLGVNSGIFPIPFFISSIAQYVGIDTNTNQCIVCWV